MGTPQYDHSATTTTTSSSARAGANAVQRRSAGAGYEAGRAALSPVNDGAVVQARDLDYNPTTNAAGEKRNPEQTDGAIPFTGALSWDGSVVLAEMTQIDDDPLTLTDNKRCAAASTLAVHIQGGPMSVARVATATFGHMTAQTFLSWLNGMPDNIKTNMEALRSVIAAIPAKIVAHTLTYRDLRRLAHCMKILVDWNPNSGTNRSEYENLTGIGNAFNAYVGQTYTGWASAQTLAGILRLIPRASCILSVSTGSVENGNTNHAVTFGNDGDIYLYDPWPRTGSQIMHLGSDQADIKEYFEHPDGTQRTWRVREVMTAA